METPMSMRLDPKSRLISVGYCRPVRTYRSTSSQQSQSYALVGTKPHNKHCGHVPPGIQQAKETAVCPPFQRYAAVSGNAPAHFSRYKDTSFQPHNNHSQDDRLNQAFLPFLTSASFAL